MLQRAHLQYAAKLRRFAVANSAIVGMLVQLVSITGLCAQTDRDKPSPLANRKSQAVDFLQEVRPILIKHCISCHGNRDQRGGLRLDNLAGAKGGGDSGRPITSNTVETNELFRRVSSLDQTYRMPKGKAPLSNVEIETIRKWVLLNCPWPENAGPITFHASGTHQAANSHADHGDVDAGNVSSLWLTREPFFTLFCWISLCSLVLTLSIARSRRQMRRGQPLGRYGKILAAITAMQLIFVWAAIVATFALVQMNGQLHDTLKELVILERQVEDFQSSSKRNITNAAKDVWGDPPIPFRLTHPKGLKRTYYRGNCERNENLFNGGNYCTASFQISLQTTNGILLEYGNQLPDEDLVLHFELNRAPGTTVELFSEDTMLGIFLTESAKLVIDPSRGSRRIQLVTTTPDWQWGGDFPVTKTVSDEGWRTGLVYVGVGRVADPSYEGEIQFGIKYELHIRDGKIDSDSDLWMGCLFIPWVVQPPPPDWQFPLNEWFDWREIPEITGPNSSDPKLLGIPKHHPQETEIPQNTTPTEILDPAKP